jgi:hypothetical protein
MDRLISVDFIRTSRLGEERRDEGTDGDEGIVRGRCIPGRKKQQPHK